MRIPEKAEMDKNEDEGTHLPVVEWVSTVEGRMTGEPKENVYQDQKACHLTLNCVSTEPTVH